MPRHLTEKEVQLIEKLHKQKKTPSEILTKLQNKRAKNDGTSIIKLGWSRARSRRRRE